VEAVKPDALLGWMRRQEALPAPAPGPLCIQCGGASGHGPIDELVCYPCILSIGRVVADPGVQSSSILAVWWEDHKDVVSLRSCIVHIVDWVWTDEWPGPDVLEASAS
jgi:hypothetical protein